MAQQLAGLVSVLQNIQVPAGIQPHIIRLPSPPRLEGALAPNAWLAKVQKHANNKVLGPESMVIFKGYVYTGQADGWVVEVSPFGVVRKLIHLSANTCRRRPMVEGACGRPMGMRLTSRGYLFVADAYHGIFQINPRTGRFKQLVNSRTLRVNNRRLGYINDLAVASDGTVFFTSSSSKWSVRRENNIIFGADNTGRVLFYNPRERRAEKRVQELVTSLSFPNGLELSPDETFLLVAEGTRSRILRVWVGQTTPVQGRIEVFASNLPGVVDNIRISPRGTYWVGISQSRHQGMPSVLDTFGNKPRIRGALMTLVNRNVKFDNPKFGIVVEVSGEGKVLRSLQDPEGNLYTGVSEVREYKGVLFLASPGKRFIGFLKLDSTMTGPEHNDTRPEDMDQTGTAPSGQPSTGQPSTGQPSTGQPSTEQVSSGSDSSSNSPSSSSPSSSGPSSAGPSSSGPSGTGSTDLVPSFSGSGMTGMPSIMQDPRVMMFLNRIRDNMNKMTAQRVKQIVVELVKELIRAKQQSLYLRRITLAREEDLRQLRVALQQLQENRGASGGEQGEGAGTTPGEAETPEGTGTSEASGSQATTRSTGDSDVSTGATLDTTTSGSGSGTGTSPVSTTIGGGTRTTEDTITTTTTTTTTTTRQTTMSSSSQTAAPTTTSTPTTTPSPITTTTAVITTPTSTPTSTTSTTTSSTVPVPFE